MRVKIVDRTDPNRVLGTVPTPATPPRGHTISFFLSEELNAFAPRLDQYTPTRASLRAIDLEIEVIITNRGWKREFVLATNEPLDLLVKLPDFRHPTREDRLR